MLWIALGQTSKFDIFGQENTQDTDYIFVEMGINKIKQVKIWYKIDKNYL